LPPIASQRKHAASGGLPVELSSFVGRGRELSEIRRLLPVAHTVTLTGAGGIGKSRLALRVAHRLGRHFPDGVWMVELAELENPDLLAYAVANSMRVNERPDQVIEDSLMAHLRERRLLLVLDNCEHLLDACRELVASLVSACEGVRILCTSRQRMGNPGEATVALSPLDLPAAAEELPIAALAEVEALRLLVDRAVAVAPGFALSDENRAAATEICRRLDGLPLAIELASVRLASMTADDLLARLDDRFHLLAGGQPVGSPRSQALRATVDWSHDLLDEEERILWRRLSVFAGSFGLEAVEAVCSSDGLRRQRILDIVGSLVDKSILTMGHRGRQGRYRLLETVRLYGAARLREAGEELEFGRRHLAWYAQLISVGDRARWATPEQLDVIVALDVEWANVEAALEFSAGSPPDVGVGLRMAADLWLYWMVRARYRIGCRHLEAFLAMSPTPGPDRAMALCAFGFLAQAVGEEPVALAHLEEAEAACLGIGMERELAYALFGLGSVRLRLGEIELARDLLAKSCETMARVEDSMGLGIALYFSATTAAAVGETGDARRFAQEGLEAARRAGDTFLRGVLSTLLGIVEWQLGDLPAADEKLKEAVRTHDAIGHRWGMVTSLEGLAWVAGSSGRLERASLLLGAAAALWQEEGVPLVPYWQPHHDGCAAAARAGLGEPRYRVHWEEGHALDRQRQVAAALEEAILTGPAAAVVTSESDASGLTARELEVARLVAQGLSNPAIAEALFISPATAKTHVSHILGKLSLESRVQLAGWMAGHEPGFVTTDP
jgi:predicted ATPase/DNA-binding CsgD family transcriptional regulator